MPNINDLIREASELPVEDRARVIDSLLRTLNAPDPEVDRAWLEAARVRLEDLRSGLVKPVPGEEVFSKIKDLFGR